MTTTNSTIEPTTNNAASTGASDAGRSPSDDSGPRLLPLVPLRDVVVFPGMIVPLFVGRPRSALALEAAMGRDRLIAVATQRDATVDEPAPEGIFDVGTLALVRQHVRMPDGTVKVAIEGRQRLRIVRHVPGPKYLMVEVTTLTANATDSPETAALMRSVQATFGALAKLTRRFPPELARHVESVSEPGALADAVVAHLKAKVPDRQAVLELLPPAERLARVFELLQAEVEVVTLERRIRARVKKQMEKSQKEYYLHEQLSAIHKELGERDGNETEMAELDKRLADKQLPDEHRERIAREIRKLRKMSPLSPEATVVRNYVDWCLALPWNEVSSDTLDLDAAARILDEDHFGLEKPKERIIDYLAVQALVAREQGRLRGPLLCFVGPPGVGKTSLGKSIARCMGRRFVRLSLGGVRDEAEIRGHRRTYIGSMPGKIIQSLRRAGTSNPVVVLDELDKLANDFRGDPASALLEVLDPEVNQAFNDHYLELDYDLSRVLFICTANNVGGIPPALLDRVELIRIPGYTETEKLTIAARHLIPKQQRENGLSAAHIEWPEAVTSMIIRRYTREAGVRNLERELARVCRKVARAVASGTAPDPLVLTEAGVHDYLGVYHFPEKRRDARDQIGIATGLAWTEAGGEVLAIEVALMPGKGEVLITGKLGDVMKESARAALSYVRSRAYRLGLATDFAQSIDVHLHIPEGATPKDGPSAGITIATALVSALTRLPVRSDVAMTGEITLRGRVLPIGGLKEKALAAYGAECTTLIYPRDNDKDVPDLPAELAGRLRLVSVEHMDEVLDYALVHPAGTPVFATTDEPDPVEQRLHGVTHAAPSVLTQ